MDMFPLVSRLCYVLVLANMHRLRMPGLVGVADTARRCDRVRSRICLDVVGNIYRWLIANL